MLKAKPAQKRHFAEKIRAMVAAGPHVLANSE
jgi:hypothetical protein